MGSKEWLLNANAIKKAKICIQLIEQELEIRLKLTHPQFLEMIKDYADLAGSSELQNAYNDLAELAGVEIETKAPLLKNVVNMTQFGDYNNSAAPKISSKSFRKIQSSIETVAYHGKEYPKYNDSGLMFKGLYRGQARYA